VAGGSASPDAPEWGLSRALSALVSCGFAAVTLDCRFCGLGFGWSSGEAEPAGSAGVGGSVPVAETLSTAAAAVLTLVVLSAPALPFRDGSKSIRVKVVGSGGSSVHTQPGSPLGPSP
jgi:hypothetical protein